MTDANPKLPEIGHLFWSNAAQVWPLVERGRIRTENRQSSTRLVTVGVSTKVARKRRPILPEFGRDGPKFSRISPDSPRLRPTSLRLVSAPVDGILGDFGRKPSDSGKLGLRSRNVRSARSAAPHSPVIARVGSTSAGTWPNSGPKWPTSAEIACGVGVSAKHWSNSGLCCPKLCKSWPNRPTMSPKRWAQNKKYLPNVCAINS